MSKLLSWLFIGFLEKWDPYVTDALKAKFSCSMPQTHPPQNPVLHQDFGARVRQKVRSRYACCMTEQLVSTKDLQKINTSVI